LIAPERTFLARRVAREAGAVAGELSGLWI